MAVTFNMTAFTDGFPFTLPLSRFISPLESGCCARNPAAVPWHVSCDYIFLTEPEYCRFSCGSGAVRASGNAEQPTGKTKGAVGKDKQVFAQVSVHASSSRMGHRHARHRIDRHPGFTVSGCIADLASQPKLGLLPEWRVGPDPFDPAHPTSVGPHIGGRIVCTHLQQMIQARRLPGQNRKWIGQAS